MREIRFRPPIEFHLMNFATAHERHAFRLSQALQLLSLSRPLHDARNDVGC